MKALRVGRGSVALKGLTHLPIASNDIAKVTYHGRQGAVAGADADAGREAH